MDLPIPTVSIIVPVYQVSAYIERCIISVMAQTYKGRMECIIINDATKDDSIEICERLIQHYCGPINFKIVNHEKNRGLSASRNTGIDVAIGDYLFFLDSDDDITPACIEKLMSFVIDDSSIEMVQGNYLKISGNNEELGKSISLQAIGNDNVRIQFLTYRRMNEFVWNKLLKRSVIIENNLHNKEGLICEDTLWTFHLIRYISRACLCADITYHYRIRSASIVTGTSSRMKGLSYCVTYNEILNGLTKDKECEELAGFVYNFSHKYASCVRSTPELKPLMKLYKQRAKTYKCFYVLFVLSTVCTLCQVVNLPPILDKLNDIRMKFRKK